MFNRARLKLTLWYVLIIMSISLSFSLIIYQLLQNEIQRITFVQQQRILLESDRVLIPFTIDEEILNESRQRLLSVLLIVNGGIFVVAGGLAYLLAGETLKPIQEMVEDQNRFISDASHELRTPLTALKSTMEVNIRDPHLTLKEARTLISESIEEVDKLQKLSDDLLQLARFKHVSSEPYFKPVALEKIIRQAVTKVKPLAAKKKIKLEVTNPAIMIEGQADSLCQVFVIILDNAIKYSPNGSSVTLTSKKASKAVQIIITDHGAGIARKDLPHIFDRFYRTDSARSKAEVGGYGLGLSIAKQIIKVHQGQILVQSQVGKGTSFALALPLSQS